MRVEVHRIGTGYIKRTRYDDSGLAIFTVVLDNPALTPTGYILARPCEVRYLKKGE